jgi:hypothetical protein
VLVGEPVVVQLKDVLVEVVEDGGVAVNATAGAVTGGGGEPPSTREPKFCVQ